MKSLNLRSTTSPHEVILDEFDEDKNLTLLTVIDEEGAATNSLDIQELVQIRDWLTSRIDELDIALSFERI